jgi:MYXO-CTERM domain-containing protein
VEALTGADGLIGFQGVGGNGNFVLTEFNVFVNVPEPSTFALAALGLLGLGFVGRRRRRK